MSSFKNFAPMLSSLQDQADGKGTIAGSPLEDFLSIAGYETPGGGGGSSDFITAEVTLDNGVIGASLTNIPYFVLDDEVASDYYEWDTQIATSDTYNVVLYKGVTYAWLSDEQSAVQNVSVTGSIEYDSEEFMFTIKGDGTITLKSNED